MKTLQSGFYSATLKQLSSNEVAKGKFAPVIKENGKSHFEGYLTNSEGGSTRAIFTANANQEFEGFQASLKLYSEDGNYSIKMACVGKELVLGRLGKFPGLFCGPISCDR